MNVDLSVTSQQNLLPYDGEVYDYGLVLDAPEPLYETLLTQLPWQADVVKLFGKTHITRRQIVWMADGQTGYRYSGHTRTPMPWTPEVFHVKHRIERLLAHQGESFRSVNFDACLLNYYPTGAEGMGYHADDESVLGARSVIASVSLGARRKFIFKHRITKETVTLWLEAGQLLVMAGDTQRHWLHSLPKSAKVHEGRINLTFRQLHRH